MSNQIQEKLNEYLTINKDLKVLRKHQRELKQKSDLLEKEIKNFFVLLIFQLKLNNHYF